ncbi:hypothetical protein AX16_006501 [Volvariella volvacea WC 439]|nr:hypothetical protein AX16_006501 [Volvariella volvacea WC 439]
MDKIPIEIWYNIATFVYAKNDLLRLRSVCRLYHVVFTPFVVSSVGIEIASPPRNFVVDRRLLILRTARPLAFESVPEAFVEHITFLHIDIASAKCLSPTDLALTKVWNELWRFRGLKKLRISCLGLEQRGPGTTDAQVVLDKVLDPIISATGGRLTYLSLDLSRSTEVMSFPGALERVRGLETFEFSHTCEKEALFSSFNTSPSACLSLLHSILTSNPSIKTLDYQRFGPQVAIPLNAVLLPHTDFKRLRFVSHLLPAPASHPSLCLPTLTGLQQLELSHDSYTSSANIDQFWISLKASGAALKKLNTHSISPALLDYLASYQGLQDCAFTLTRQDHPHSISTASIQRAFAPHCATLASLSIGARTETIPEGYEGFSFLPSAWIDPSRFPALRTLKVPCSTDFELTEENHASILEFVSRFVDLLIVTIRWHGSVSSQAEKLQTYYRTRTGRPHTLFIEHDHFERSDFVNVALLEGGSLD